jgi:hypothetical protein
VIIFSVQFLSQNTFILFDKMIINKRKWAQKITKSIMSTAENTASEKEEVTKQKGSGSGKKRFEVKKWNAVALWAWDIVVDNCAICRNHIMDLCECHLPAGRQKFLLLISATIRY